MLIQVDTREKAKAIRNILAHFDKNNINYISSKLFVGDYMNLDNPFVVVDRKQNLSELCQNVAQGHKRFMDEIKRAEQNGFKIIFLVEHSNRIKTLEDVNKWVNPRLKVSPMAISGTRLFKILYSIRANHNVEFEFCDKAHTGARIIELLKKG